MMAVDVTTKTALVAGKPEVLFEGRYDERTLPRANYDVTPDSRRFLMVKTNERQAPTQLKVVLNWFEELKRRVPAAMK